MRKFQITVNGQSYEVEVEEVGASAPAAAPVVAPAPVAAPAPAAIAPKAAPAAAPKAAAAPAGAEAIKAPMPGNSNDVKVAAGQSGKKGDDLVIL